MRQPYFELDEEEQSLPNATMFTTMTRCSSGTSVKFAACTQGHTIQFLVKAVLYVLSSLSFGLVPSMIAMELKKQNRFVDANTV